MKKIPSATSGLGCSFGGVGVASEECTFYKIYPKMLLLWFFAMRCTFFPSNLCFGQKQNFVQKGQDQEIIWSFDDSISIDWFYLMLTKMRYAVVCIQSATICVAWRRLDWPIEEPWKKSFCLRGVIHCYSLCSKKHWYYAINKSSIFTITKQS